MRYHGSELDQVSQVNVILQIVHAAIMDTTSMCILAVHCCRCHSPSSSSLLRERFLPALDLGAEHRTSPELDLRAVLSFGPTSSHGGAHEALEISDLKRLCYLHKTCYHAISIRYTISISQAISKSHAISISQDIPLIYAYLISDEYMNDALFADEARS